MDFLHRETNSDILLLGIQPAHIRLGEGLSEPVKKSIENISNLLMENITDA
jgi:Ni,Fe-hydrogenase maturation factor